MGVQSVKAKPNFLVIGAAKSGTTSLCYGLSRHAEVFITDPKEPHFFSAHYDRGWDWYASLFSEGDSCKARGEGSVSYTMESHQPDVARRIARDLPDARLIYIVRHPLRRIESGWRHKLRSNRTRLGLSESVEKFPGLISTSLYWRQISYYRDFFPDERIHVAFFEDFVEDQEAVLRDCWRFLGVDPDVRLKAAPEARNVSDGMWAGPVATALRRIPLVRKLRPPAWAVKMLRKVLYRRLREEERNPEWTSGASQKAMEMIEPDAAQFLRFCGKPPDFWRFGETEVVDEQAARP
ncbi:MAG: sulfotransferase family protein [Planctomycetota bacterium]